MPNSFFATFVSFARHFPEWFLAKDMKETKVKKNTDWIAAVSEPPSQ
jgi:hypothetical protein